MQALNILIRLRILAVCQVGARFSVFIDCAPALQAIGPVLRVVGETGSTLDLASAREGPVDPAAASVSLGRRCGGDSVSSRPCQGAEVKRASLAAGNSRTPCREAFLGMEG